MVRSLGYLLKQTNSTGCEEIGYSVCQSFVPLCTRPFSQYLILLEACGVLGSVELLCPFYRWKQAQGGAEGCSRPHGSLPRSRAQAQRP